jgi:hypothetical protein
VFNLRPKAEILMPEKFTYRSSVPAVFQQGESHEKVHNSRYNKSRVLKFYEDTERRISSTLVFEGQDKTAGKEV